MPSAGKGAGGFASNGCVFSVHNAVEIGFNVLLVFLFHLIYDVTDFMYPAAVHGGKQEAERPKAHFHRLLRLTLGVVRLSRDGTDR